MRYCWDFGIHVGHCGCAAGSIPVLRNDPHNFCAVRGPGKLNGFSKQRNMEERSEAALKKFMQLAPLHADDIKSQIADSLHVCKAIAEKRGDVGALAKQLIPIFERILASVRKTPSARKSKETRRKSKHGGGVIGKSFLTVYLIATLLVGVLLYREAPRIITAVSPTQVMNVVNNAMGGILANLQIWKYDPDSDTILPESVLRECLKGYDSQLIEDSALSKKYQSMIDTLDDQRRKLEMDVINTWAHISKAELFQNYKHMLESQTQKVITKQPIQDTLEIKPTGGLFGSLGSLGSIFTSTSKESAAIIAAEEVQPTPVYIQDQLEWFQTHVGSSNYTALYTVVANVTSSFYPTITLPEIKGKSPYLVSTSGVAPGSLPSVHQNIVVRKNSKFLTYSKPNFGGISNMTAAAFFAELGRPYTKPPAINVLSNRIQLDTSDFDSFMKDITATLRANEMDESVMHLITDMIRIRYLDYIMHYITVINTKTTYVEANSKIISARKNNDNNLEKIMYDLSESEKSQIQSWFYYLDGKYIDIPKPVFELLRKCAKNPASCKMLTVRDVRLIESEYDIYNANAEDLIVRLLVSLVGMMGLLLVGALGIEILDIVRGLFPNFRGMTERPAPPAIEYAPASRVSRISRIRNVSASARGRTRASSVSRRIRMPAQQIANRPHAIRPGTPEEINE